MIKMKDKEWDRFYKPINAVANVLYEPLISKDKKVFCMNWNPSTCLLYTSPSPRDRG